MMSSLSLKIPKRVSDNFGEPIKQFLEILSKVNSNGYGRKIDFDFSETKFISPFLVGGLSYIANRNIAEGGNSIIFNPKNDFFNSYLDNIFFYKGYQEKTERNLDYYNSKNYTPLVKFPLSSSEESVIYREGILNALNEILKKQLNLSGDFRTALYYLIDELTQNIIDHSNSEFGIIFSQFFPSKNYMDICISDAGKGLFNSYIDSGKHNPTNNQEAVNFAVYGKSTKDIPESRGFGLSTSRKMLVEGLKGKFFLMSGDSFFIQTVDKEEIISLPKTFDISGCYIALRVPILDSKSFNPYNYME